MELASLLKRAKAEAIPKSTVDLALKKAEGMEKMDLAPVVYEALGPGGVAMIVEALTDNKARAITSIRTPISQAGGSLTTVGFIFDKKGVLQVSPGTSGHSLDIVMDNCIEAGAEDIEEVEVDEGGDNGMKATQLVEVVTDPPNVRTIKDALERLNYSIVSLDPGSYIPRDTVELTGEDAEAFEKLLGKLEDLDEVVKVHHNAT
ncbi:hypothetical protein HDU93_003166 [Gonapodya sp. JEL0774]|nr:hypothetical protein HDU93_003166 [Gonapodya sp. JEL0774]